MRQRFLWMVLIAALTLAAELTATAQPRASSNQVVLNGRVVEIYSRRLFSVREAEPGKREIFVLAPRPLSLDLKDGSVRVEGTLRRLTAAELKQFIAEDAAGEQLRSRLADRVVLVASSVLATMEGETTAAESRPEQLSKERLRETERPEAAVASGPPPPLTLRASVFMADLQGFAGRSVRILNARVVGVLEQHAFLVEPATQHLKDMGTRDRIVVLLSGTELSVPARLIVGDIVTIEGVARTLLSVQATSEVPWPARLEPDTIKRLEVRAALMATSVQTAEGTELTNRRVARVGGL